jgi:hypothetical protein
MARCSLVHTDPWKRRKKRKANVHTSPLALTTCRRPETSPSNDENLTIIPRLLAKTNRKVGVAADTKPAPVCLCVPENNGFEPSHTI